MEDKIKEWFDKLTEFCKDKPFKISDDWEDIIEGIVLKSGNCPCRFLPTKCPCPFHEDEIKEHGQCICGLFVSK